jgi:aldehyde dehydrogenase
MIYAQPGQQDCKITFKTRYENFINGDWVAPTKGQYVDNIAPAIGKPFCQVPCSSVDDIDAALDAAYAAKSAWARTSPADRSVILMKIADRLQDNLELLAVAEAWDKGKVIRDTLAGDIPGVIDTFRYFATCIRTQSSDISRIDENTVCYHFHEPLGVVAAIVPWNFPLVTMAWKVAPALAAGNCVVLKPASLTPVSALVFAELIADLLPPGVLNIVNGPGAEIGKALATSPRVGMVSLTGETTTGRLIMQYAAQNIIPVSLELGGKSPNIFFADVAAEDDSFFDKALEGLMLFCMNSGEICTCPSRALVQESIYEKFMDRILARVAKVRQGNPLDTETMMGAIVSAKQLERVSDYVQIGCREGAECLAGGQRNILPGDLKDGFYYQPTILKGHNKMRVFQEEIFGPVVCVTTFKDEAEALEIANDSSYGLAAGIWTRNQNTAFRVSQGVQSGIVWVNTYLAVPRGMTCAGFKQSGVGSENYKTTLEHYQQTKCVHVSYSEKAMGLF